MTLENGMQICYTVSMESTKKTTFVKGAAILAAAGLQVSIITDAPVIPQQYLPLCAGLAVKAGMDPFQALQAITINPAKHIGIEDRVGSIEPGKDADIVLSAGNPMVSDSEIKYVIVDGKVLVGNLK